MRAKIEAEKTREKEHKAVCMAIAGVKDESRKDIKEMKEAFVEFTNRDDVGSGLVNQHGAAQSRHLLDDYSKTIPTVLEMPSKDMPYDPAQDYIMQRVSAMLNTGD